MVPVTHLERWVTDERDVGIRRGSCAVCGAAVGEIGLYAPAAARSQTEPAWSPRLPVAAGDGRG